MSSDFGLRIGVEGEKAFKQALSEINQSFKVLGSEMKLATAEFDRNDKSVAALTARNTELNKQVEAQRDKISTLKTALDNAAESFGENDKRTQNWQIQLNKAETELIGMEKELKNNNNALKSNAERYDALGKEIDITTREYVRVRKEYGENSAEAKALEAKLKGLTAEHKAAGKAADEEEREIAKVTKAIKPYQRETGESTEKTNKFGAALKTAGMAIGAAAVAIGAATIAAGKSLFDMGMATSDAANEVDKMSQKMGLSRQGYQEWKYILDQNGKSIENLTGSFKYFQVGLSKTGDDAKKMEANLSKLGLSLSDLQGMSTEDAYEKLIKAFQGMEEGAEKSALAVSLLGGRYGVELMPMLNSTAEEMDALRQRAHELGAVMSNETIDAGVHLNNSMTDLKTAFRGVRSSIGADLLPGLASIVVGLTGVMTGSDDASEQLTKGINEMVAGISKAVPKLLDVFMGIFDAIMILLPKLLDAFLSLFNDLMAKLLQLMPRTVDTAVKLVLGLIAGIVSMLPNFVEAGLDIVKALAEGLGNAIPLLKPFTTIISGVMDVLKAVAPVAAAAAAAFGAFMVVQKITAMLKGFTAATAAHTIATNIKAVALGIATAAQWLLNAAMIGINAGHFNVPASKNHSGISYFYKIKDVLDVIDSPSKSC
jgi:septal ring factor EnvC (AmiA/AmiB activator)